MKAVVVVVQERAQVEGAFPGHETAVVDSFNVVAVRGSGSGSGSGRGSGRGR